jgi:hypothetical protein
MEELERLRLKEGRLQAISNCAAQPFSGAKWKRWHDLRQELKVSLPRQAEVKAQRDHIYAVTFLTRLIAIVGKQNHARIRHTQESATHFFLFAALLILALADRLCIEQHTSPHSILVCVGHWTGSNSLCPVDAHEYNSKSNGCHFGTIWPGHCTAIDSFCPSTHGISQRGRFKIINASIWTVPPIPRTTSCLYELLSAAAESRTVCPVCIEP